LSKEAGQAGKKGASEWMPRAAESAGKIVTTTQRGSALLQESMNHFAMHIDQAEVAAGVAVGKRLV
jgi:hypothetical protein